MMNFYDEFNNIFRQSADHVRKALVETNEYFSGACFYPECNSYQIENTLYYTFDVPGVSENDINLRIKNSYIILKGERSVDSNATYLYSESKRGQFRRAIKIDPDLETRKLNVTLNNGVLYLLFDLENAKDPYTVYAESIRVISI